MDARVKNSELPVSVVTIKVAELVPYARNARTHSDEQVAQIAASIREFGWTNPVLVDSDGGIIAGHGRVLAARKLGIVDAPCIVLSHLTEAQKRAYVIADNKLALNAGWDDELLSIELQDLQQMDFDLGLTGFSSEELDAMLKDEKTPGNEETEDDIPEVPVDPITKTGDVWLLGVSYQCEACGKQYSQEEGEMMTHCPCDDEHG